MFLTFELQGFMFAYFQRGQWLCR